MPLEDLARGRTKPPALWERLRNHRLAPPGRLASQFDSRDPAELERRLQQSDCFCRDTGMGRMFHPKAVSFREISQTDSLHVTLEEGSVVSAHVDRHSPLARRQPGGDCRYSPLRIAAHNVSGMAGDLVRLARRHKGPPEEDAQSDGGLFDDDAMVQTLAAKESSAKETSAGETSIGETDLAFAAIDVAVHRCVDQWDVRLEARVAGSLDQARLQAALDVALADPVHRHLRSRHVPVEVVDGGSAEVMRQIRSPRCPPADAADGGASLRMDLACDPAGDLLVVHVDGAGDDGVGALRLLHSITRAYAG